MTDKKTNSTKTSTPATKQRNPEAFSVPAKTPEEQARNGAELVTSGRLNAMVVHNYLPVDGVGVAPVHDAMARQADAIKADCERIHQAEAMLLNQAAALQAMFVDLANRAKLQNNREFIQTLTGLALRAQTNCTQTLKTLGELRNPRQAVFARQANIAHGHQQVNYGNQPVTNQTTRTGAHESPIEQNRVLENDHGQWLDTGAARTSGRIDSNLEAVAERQRASDT
ncbi:MAG: hypothetical protein Q8S32_14550 [Burkholderiaceae bacterium]|nr:hypothetical protein [Burkholderiaceae bacterium]